MPAPETIPTVLPTWVLLTQDIAYLVAAVLFIFGIKQLSSPRTARRGNTTAAVGMLIAIVATLYVQNYLSLVWIAIALVIGSAVGAVLAIRIQMTAMPQLVALFNGFGGLASVLVVGSEYLRRSDDVNLPITVDQGLTMGLSVLVGTVTFTGSMVAYGKLQGLIAGRPRQWSGQLVGNALMTLVSVAASIWIAVDVDAGWTLLVIALLGSILGVTLTIAIGGADMPVMVALLNSYSGIAACATGFILDPPNKALIVSGALVGASGIILTSIMCKAMNRSLANVLFGGVGTDDSTGAAGPRGDDRPVRTVDAEELALMLDGVRKVVIGPNVKISDGGTGWTLVTPEAVVDTETGVVTGDKGVQGRGPLGSINASSYAIYDQGQRVVFNGQGETKVSGTINPAGADR